MQTKKNLDPKIHEQQCAIVDRNCVFCTIAKSEKNDSWITDLEHGSVFLNFNQRFYGRLLYIPFNHYASIQEIPIDQYVDYCLELRLLSGAIQNELKADLINLAMLANKVKHVHWHLIPRYKNDERWGQPPWPNTEKTITQQEITVLKNLIRNSLSKA